MLRVRGSVPLVASLLIAVAAVLLLAYSSSLNPVDALLGRGAIVTVPDVEGRPLPRARSEVEEVGLTAEVVHAFSLSVPQGSIVRQEPAAGERLREGEPVELVVSRGANRVEMPDAVGEPIEEVSVDLDDAGIPFEVTQVPDEEVPKGIVISQTPDAGVLVTGEDRPSFEVSSGPPERPVPEILGLSLDAAAFRLGEAGLLVDDVQFLDSADVPEGAVASVEPAVGSMVERDTPVVLTVSNGPPAIRMPSVTGGSMQAAIDQLQARGLVVQTAGRLLGPAEDGEGRVFEQRPEPGASIRPGQSVTIVVGRRAPTPPPPSEPPTTPPDAVSPETTPPDAVPPGTTPPDGTTPPPPPGTSPPGTTAPPAGGGP